MRNRRANRTRSGRITPQVHVSEELAVALADTVVSTSLYSSAVGTAGLEVPMRFHFRNCVLNVTQGATATAKVFVLIRRVPSGYTPPAITITTGNLSFIDMPDILAYGFIEGFDNVPAKLEILRRTVVCHPGDAVYLQAVSNAASVGQSVSTITGYGLSTY